MIGLPERTVLAILLAILLLGMGKIFEPQLNLGIEF
jgi:hypothetical protein